MALTFILLSTACSILIAHLLKRGESRRLRTLNVLTINYLFAFVTAALVRGNLTIQQLPQVPWITWLFAAIIGSFFIANFITYSKSVNHNGVGVSVAAMRVSLLLPVIISIAGYGEELNFKKVSGIIMVFIALGLLMPRGASLKSDQLKYRWLLLILFLFTGLGDGSLKIYQEDFSMFLNKQFFMGLVFLVAFIIGAVVVVSRKGSFATKEEWVLGAFIGIPNLYSSIFLIEALELMDGAIVYTAVNLFTVLGGTLIGKIRWKDQVSRLQWIGIGTALGAIALLI
jgi:drug/metabolite transporter (DMT)-like permease